jgi:hypothetical protein
MSIYPNKKDYRKEARKVWIKHYGPIPKDENGRTYEIHHIDGDKTNNNIKNLMCVSIQEHYDIHLRQSDWNACLLIARRMKLSPELISELASTAANKRVADGTHHLLRNNNKALADGTHHLLGGEIQRKNANKRVADGSHNLLGGKIQRKTNTKRVVNGTHHLLKENGGSELARKINAKRIADGTHLFVDKEWQSKNQHKRVANGTHNLTGGVTCRDKNGNVVQVPKEVYQKQKEVTKDMTVWEYANVASNEGKKRKNVS